MLANPETIRTNVQRQVLARDWPNARRALKRATFSTIIARTANAPITRCHEYGAVAQLGERMTGSHEVRGSIPLGSTNPIKHLGHPLRMPFFVLCSSVCQLAELSFFRAILNRLRQAR